MLEITSIAADLMKIFAQRRYTTHRYDDTTAIELLKYLQTLAQAEKVPTPKLDQYLAGEYPPVHMGCHIATEATPIVPACRNFWKIANRARWTSSLFIKSTDFPDHYMTLRS
jgi:hypothetical protein